MNKLINLTAAILISCASSAIAADAPANASEPAGDCRHPMGMMGGMGPGNAMSGETMTKMQAQMAKIRQTNDPAERRKLMQEHFQSMQEAMQALRGKAGISEPPCAQNCPKPMAGDCQKRDSCPRPDSLGKSSPPAMQQRMDMMQSMMENMVEHQHQMQQSK